MGSDSVVASGPDSRQETPLTSAVFVVGPSSSGKTTLCNALAEKVKLDPARHIKEVARTVMRTHNFSRHTVKTYEMQHTIMLAQVREEQRVLQLPADETNSLCLLSDRSAIDPIVYASTSGVSDADAMRERLMREPAFLNTLSIYRRAIFIVLEPIPEWIEDDGVRSLGDPTNYYTQLCALLTELGILFVEIGKDMKDLTQRVQFVQDQISQWKRTGEMVSMS